MCGRGRTFSGRKGEHSLEETDLEPVPTDCSKRIQITSDVRGAFHCCLLEISRGSCKVSNH